MIKMLLNQGLPRTAARIRMEGLKADQVASLVERVLALASDELNQGAMITLADGKVRIKLLPVAK
jgi:hypothetical protein